MIYVLNDGKNIIDIMVVGIVMCFFIVYLFVILGIWIIIGI